MPEPNSLVFEAILAIVVVSLISYAAVNGLFSAVSSVSINVTKLVNTTGPFTPGSGSVAYSTLSLFTQHDGVYIVYALVALMLIALVVYYFAGEGSGDENENYYYYYG